jgi:DNA-binding response OmpR family regulator
MNVHSKPKVVLLDDSEVCLELARDALEDAGFEVIAARSGLGASKLLHAVNPDCVVVDVMMPALSGDKLVQIFRKNITRHIPIVLHSDRPWAELVALAKTCGASAAVTKTPTCDRLVDEVRRQVALRSPKTA